MSLLVANRDVVVESMIRETGRVLPGCALAEVSAADALWFWERRAGLFARRARPGAQSAALGWKPRWCCARSVWSV